MKRFVVIALLCSGLCACQKLGISGQLAQVVGDWAQVRLPPGCVPRQIASEEGKGVAVLCEDGRVFH